ncbi:MAG: hypothetical protein IJE97_13150, partial [Thermoguttaceae bacterium]|nr:hypothetical protein [Thermoguttaceae bacterium]
MLKNGEAAGGEKASEKSRTERELGAVCRRNEAKRGEMKSWKRSGERGAKGRRSGVCPASDFAPER